MVGVRFEPIFADVIVLNIVVSVWAGLLVALDVVKLVAVFSVVIVTGVLVVQTIEKWMAGAGTIHTLNPIEMGVAFYSIQFQTHFI